MSLVTRAVLCGLMVLAAVYAVDIFEPGLRCLYYCEPYSLLDGARRGVGILMIVGLSAAWGALCAEFTRNRAIYVPLVSILLATAGLMALLTSSPRVFGVIGGVAATAFWLVRWGDLDQASDQLRGPFKE